MPPNRIPALVRTADTTRAWGGQDHAQSIAMGITIGEKIAHWQRQGQWFSSYLSYDQSGETDAQRLLYRKMPTVEPCIKAAVNQKLYSVASLELSVSPAEDDPEGEDVAAFVKHALQASRGGSRKLVESIALPALLEGYSLCGKVWKTEDRGRHAGKIVLADLKSYDSKDYLLSLDNYKNITGIRSRVDQQDWPLTEFCHFAHMPLFENPHGTSDLRAAYRQYVILESAHKLWAIALERYTLPYFKGKYTEGNARAIEEAMKVAKANGYISLPDGADVEAVKLAVGAGEDFERAVLAQKQDAFLGITGAFLQSLEGNQTGARSIGEVHQSSAELLVWYLADCCAGVLNDQVVPQLVDWNYGSQRALPKVGFGSVNDADLAPTLALAQGLHSMGVELSMSELKKRCGNWSAPKDANDVLKQTAPPGGAGVSPFEETRNFATPYTGPNGGKGYITDSGNIVYGAMPADDTTGGQAADTSKLEAAWDATGPEGKAARQQAAKELVAVHRSNLKEAAKADYADLVKDPDLKELDRGLKNQYGYGLQASLRDAYSQATYNQTAALQEYLGESLRGPLDKTALHRAATVDRKQLRRDVAEGLNGLEQEATWARKQDYTPDGELTPEAEARDESRRQRIGAKIAQMLGTKHTEEPADALPFRGT